MKAYNILSYGFPIYLIGVEMLFRFVTGVDTSSFIGPTIAAAGITFLIPLTVPKPVTLPIESQTLVIPDGYELVSSRDSEFIKFTWIFILIGTLIWMSACTVSLRYPDWDLWVFPGHLCVGIVNYVISLLFSWIKAFI